MRDAVADVFAQAALDGVAVPLPGEFDDRESARRHAARSLERVILPAAATLLGGAARTLAREAAPAFV